MNGWMVQYNVVCFFLVFSVGIGFIMNSLIQQIFIIIYDVPDPVPGGGKKTDRSPHLHGASFKWTPTGNKGMCALDKNKLQEGDNKEC